ncbi:unnamed protein product [Heterobilharzia americana]|nr:unnamed protein product [Heterobilharzia americana]
MITESKDEKRAPLAGYSDDSLGSVTTTGSTDSCNNNEYNKINQSYKSYNPDNITSMMDESSDSTLESNQSTIIPIGILKTSTLNTIHNNCNSPNQRNHHRNNNTRGVMFNTIVTVDDGSEVIRLNCTLDNSELNKNKVPPTIDRINSSTPTTTPTSTPTTITERLPRSKISHERVNKSIPQKSNLYTDSIKSSLCTNNNNNNNIETKLSKNLQIKNDNKLEDISSQVNEFSYTPPTPPPRRTSQITQMNIDENGILTGNRQEGENIEIISPISNKRSLPLSTSADANEGVTSPCE